MTNFTELTAETAFEAYHQRGKMENYIKEAKAGFYFDKTDSSSFVANHARMILSLLAYNLVSFLKQLLPAAQVAYRLTHCAYGCLKLLEKSCIVAAKSS